MKKTMAFVLAVLFAAASSAATGALASGRTAPDQDGFRFLDRLAVLLVKAAAPGGTGDPGQDLVLLARDLKSARAAKNVDDLFAVRYGRLLSAVRQGILKDPEVLFWPMYRHTMMDFIEERTGRMPDWKEVLFHVENHGGSGVGLAILAEAIMSEIVSLHFYLETLGRRSAVHQSYMEKGLKAAASGK